MPHRFILAATLSLVITGHAAAHDPFAQNPGHGANSWIGMTFTPLLTPDESEGRMSIVHSRVPAGSGPPRHVHADEDEVFVVLEGTVTFWVDGASVEKGPGEIAFVPRGAEHAFRVSEEGASNHLVVLTPGGFDGFFVDMANGGFRIPEDMAAINETAERYGLSFTGPPLEPGE